MSYNLFLVLLLSILLAAGVNGSVEHIASTSSNTAARRTSCLSNCHLCQQMYGAHFEGHLCARTCVKLRGRLSPDCTNFASIAPFLDLSNVV
jgi:hypothetical protein